MGIADSEINTELTKAIRSKIKLYDRQKRSIIREIDTSTLVTFYRSLQEYPVYGSIYLVEFSNDGDVVRLEYSWRKAKLLDYVQARKPSALREDILLRYTFPKETGTIHHDGLVLYDSRILQQKYFQPAWASFMAVEGYGVPFEVHIPAGITEYSDYFSLQSQPFREP